MNGDKQQHTISPDIITTDYDDGVVCFGRLTESQIERFNRLPRHTVLPSEIKSMLSEDEDDEYKENDHSTSVLDKSRKNTIPIVNGETELTNNLVNKEGTSSIELKQSLTNDSSLFYSPSERKFTSNEKLIDTEIINRYIRMASLSPDVNDYNKDETEPMEVDIKSTNTSIVNTISDETMHTSTFSTNFQSKDFDESHNDTNLIEDASNVSEQKFDVEESMNCMSNIIVPAADIISEEDPEVVEVETKSPNISIVDTISDETMNTTNILFTNVQSIDFDKSSNKTCLNNETSNVAEQKYVDETESTNCLDNKEGTSSKEFKQSLINDSSLFYSPSERKFTPTEKLIDTEKINRYIRMASLSPDENVSYIDVQEEELPTFHCDDNETNSCSRSVSSVIEQRVINNHKILDGDDNVCTLKHCSQQEDEDISYCSELGEGIDESSIVTDKYSVTPGKQRLFDSRLAKPSFRAKTFVASAPFMDRIEETATPLPNVLNSPSILVDDAGYEPSGNVGNLDTSVTVLGCKSSAEDFNETSGDWEFNSKKSIDETLGDLSKSTNFNHSVSESGAGNCIDYNKLAAIEMERESLSYDSIVESTYDNNLQSTLLDIKELSNDETKIDFDKPLMDTKQIVDIEKSMNLDIYDTTDIYDYNNEESEAMEVDIKSANTSIVNTISDETMHSNTFSTNIQCKDVDKSFNDSLIKDVSNVAEQNFDVEKSLNNMSNITVPTADIINNDYNNEEEPKVTEVKMRSTNTSVVDTIFDKTLNETTQTNDTSNVTNCKFDKNDYNNEEEPEATVEMKSTNTSVVDTIFDKSLNTTTQTNDTSNVTNCKFDKKSLDNKYVSVGVNDTLQLSEFRDNNLKDSTNKNLEISCLENTDYSHDIFETDVKISKDSSHKMRQYLQFEQTMDDEYNDISSELNNTKLSESNNYGSQTLENISMVEQVLNSDSSLSVSPLKQDLSVIIENRTLEDNCGDIMVKNEHLKNLTNDTTSTSDVINEFQINETLNQSTNQYNLKSIISDNVSKSSNENNCTTNVAEQAFDVEKSVNCLSGKIITLANIINDEESQTMELEIKSTIGSVVDKICDVSLNETTQTNNTSNVTNCKFDKKSLDNKFVSVGVNDTLQLSEFRDNNLKDSTNKNLEISCLEKTDYSHDIFETDDTISKDSSHKMRQFLHFEQTMDNTCNGISSEYYSMKLNESNNYGNQTLENISIIEQILSSDSFNAMKDDSLSDGSLKQDLPVIIENRTLKDNYGDNILQNEHLKNLIDNESTSSPENIMNEFQDNETLNKSTKIQNELKSIISDDISKSHLNETDFNRFEKKRDSIESVFIINNINTSFPLIENKDRKSGITLDEKLIETEHNKSSVSSNTLSSTESCLLGEESHLNKSIKKSPSPKDVNETSFNQNNLDKNDLHQIPIQKNMGIPNFKATECILEPEHFNQEQNLFLNNSVQQLDSLSTPENIYDNSLAEYTKLEKMCILEEKLQTFDYKTPKTQNLLDLSIVKRTPTFGNLVKKQKLLNFSIVDQTPIRENTQQLCMDKDAAGKNDISIDFSVADQTLGLETLPDNIHFKDNLINSSRDNFSKNLLTISAPDIELLADESLKTSSSNCSNLSLNQTITDTNLNLFTCPGKTNKSEAGIDKKDSEETKYGVSLSDKNDCSMMLINEQIGNDKSSSLNKTTEQIDLELSRTTESKENESCHKPCMNETTIGGIKYQSTCPSKNYLYQNIEKLDSTELIVDSNQKTALKSDLCAIKDFSIVEQHFLPTPDSNRNRANTSIESNWNVSNLIEMSVVSNIDTKSNDQVLFSSDNLVKDVTSDYKSEKSINSSLDEMNNTAIQIEESMFSQNTELLTDIQMNDVSLMMSPEKSSIGESFHSIELDQQEDNKRKIELAQEHHGNEKKMKIETEEPKTPISVLDKEPKTPKSMLYKLRNLFTSSEKPPIYRSNTKENNFKSDNCHQKLNFNKAEENKDKSIVYKKPESLIKSKIPCKVSDRSILKNCEFNNSSSSLNDSSIKPKKAIPKLIGAPVLSDVSNSSNKKFAESRIPSKLKK